MKKIAITLFCIVFSIAVQAQQTRLVGSYSWKTINSLMGMSFDMAQSTLKTNGMFLKDQWSDDELGETNIYFELVKPIKPGYQPQYLLILAGNKVVAVSVVIEYLKGETTMVKSDYQDMINKVSAAGFVLNPDKCVETIKAFDHKSLSYGIELDMEEDFQSFSIGLGADKYLGLFR